MAPAQWPNESISGVNNSRRILKTGEDSSKNYQNVKKKKLKKKKVNMRKFQGWKSVYLIKNKASAACEYLQRKEKFISR